MVEGAHDRLGEERFACRECYGRLRVLGSDSAPLPPSTDLADVVTGRDARLEVDAPKVDDLPTAERLGLCTCSDPSLAKLWRFVESLQVCRWVTPRLLVTSRVADTGGGEQ